MDDTGGAVLMVEVVVIDAVVVAVDMSLLILWEGGE